MNVSNSVLRILVLATLGAAGAPAFCATVLVDTTFSNINGANGIATIAGQGSTTIQTIAIVPGGLGGTDGVSACQVAVSGCNAPGGSVTWSSYPAIPGAVVSVNAIAGTTSQFGSNGLQATMNLTSSGGSTVAGGNTSLNLSTRDQQQLILRTTGTVTTPIPVRMTYSMIATVQNNSTGAQPLNVSSGASLVLAQASTFIPSQLGLYSAFAPFWASVSATTALGSDASFGTVTLNLLANELYVLNQQSFQNVLLGAGTNYSGLAISMFVLADPSFEIDPSFVLPAGATVDIQRVTNTAPVPLPAGVWLLGSGLTSLLGLRRRKRNVLA